MTDVLSHIGTLRTLIQLSFDTLKSQFMDRPFNTCLDDLVSFYNSHLSVIFNQLGPQKTCIISFLRSAPWFTPVLRKLLGAYFSGQAERLAKDKDKELFIHRHIRIIFWPTKSLLIMLNPSITPLSLVGDRALFSTVNKLLQPTKPFPLTPSADLCCEFLNFFAK